MGYLKLLSVILVLLLLFDNTDGQSKTPSKTSNSKTPSKAPSKAPSKVGGSGGNRSPFGQGKISPNCKVPSSPLNGNVNCKSTASERTCTAICFDGYQFPDSTYTKKITCGSDGISKPITQFPNCEPVCSPPCQNGGTCAGNNICLCRQDYWGRLCDAPVSVCDLKATHSVGYTCDIQEDVMTCTLSCENGMKFEFPAEPVYYCDPSGRWNPSKIPNCIQDNPTKNNENVVSSNYEGGSHGSGSQTETNTHGGGGYGDGGHGGSSLTGTDTHDGSGHTEENAIKTHESGSKIPETTPAPEKISDKCQNPPAPTNGRMSCRRNSTTLACTGECYTGYQFPNKRKTKLITCGSDGVLKPTAKFPRCKPICDPPCQNEGTCVGPNTCSCHKDYWGKACETPVSVCDLQATHKVGYECKIQNDVMTCVLSCGQGMVFEFPPEPAYSCTPSGIWSPSNIPNCISNYRPNSGNEPIKTHENIKDSTATTTKPSIPQISPDCRPPSAPVNGRMSCRSNSTQLTCTGECYNGYQFPDKHKTKRITCDSTGISKPITHFPDCEPICDPPCQNGGTCVAKDMCLCKNEYWGKLCDTPVSVCDLQATHSVGYECNIQQDIMSCALSCGDGMKFEFPPEAAYYCTPSGKWNPPEIPNCVLNDISGHSHSYNTRVDDSKTETTTKKPQVTGNEENAYLIDGPLGPHEQIHYTTLSKLNGRCVSWERKHFQSFDGRMYGFEGGCSYLLVKDCTDNTYSIYLNMNKECKTAPCPVSLHIYINGNQFVLKNENGSPSLFVGDKQLSIPFSVNNINVRYISHYIAVDSDFGFRLLWDGETFVQVDASPQSKNNTCGLCGRYDDNPVNDMETFDGFATNNVITFANSWKISDLGELCDDTNYVKDSCHNLSEEVLKEAKRYCREIKNKRYEDCLYLLDPAAYIEACISEYCTCYTNKQDNCGCTSISIFFKECARVLGRQSYEWRQNNFCNITCSKDMIYQDCGSDCPATCANPNQKCKSDWCNDGCFCAKGMLLGPDNQCFYPSDCPCLYHNKNYPTGTSVQQDCNTCKCVSGQWHCSKEVCEARCSAVGDPHYTTFDGKHYNFMGKCSYYLISNANYSIEQEFIACDEPSAPRTKGSTPLDDILQPSCTKTITIRTPGSELHLKQDYSMVLNSRELVKLPHIQSGMYIYRPSSSFIKIELMNGLTIQWDGESRLYIDAPPSLLNSLQGLCGTFTQTQKDDFLTPEGDVENTVNSFANKWKTDDYCADMPSSALEFQPCAINPHLEQDAKQLCYQIESSDFAACHDIVDPEPYIQNCIYDVCACKNSEAINCFCSSVANYAAMCAKKGAVIEWRSNECEIKCPSGQVYSQCSSSCSRSCMDIISNTKCTEQCVEGCNCPLGMTLNSENECIPVSECTCLFSDEEYPAGYSTVREKQICTCVNAIWECRVATPEELKKAELAKQDECSEADNMELTDCLVECPITCSNFHKPPICTTVKCKPGCKCKDGYIYDTKAKKCVKSSECPCHHNDRTYKPGETMLQDCNLCLCEEARWKCEKRECPGICYTSGDSHIKTFDGRMFEFVGDCEYTLAQGSRDANTQFTINVQTMPCGDTEITCFTATTFILGNEQLQLSKNEPIPQLNGNSRFIIHKVGLFVVVHTDIGVTLYWDHGTRVYIKLQSQWKSTVKGLCGDFNDNEMDDFQSPSGGPTLTLATEFADSWKVHSYCSNSEHVRDHCKVNPQRLAWAQKKCGVLKSELFSSCHSDVPVDPFLEKCISDTCGCDIGNDCECTCTAIATYAQECSIIGKPITWRSQELCPIQCRECDKYTPCMSVCPKTTCETEFLYKELSDTCKDEMCIEGCDPPVCEIDQIYKDDKEYECIPKEECIQQPCKIINGVMYHEGERITDESVVMPCQSCHCQQGQIDCKGEPCPSLLVEPTTTTSKPPTPIKKECNNMSHWSEWINSYKPTYDNGGDYEIVKNLVEGPYDLCPLDYITAIECRDAKTHQLASNTGDLVHCTVSTGLMCENSLQTPDPICRDYEIRLFCDCDKNLPTTTVIPRLEVPPIECTSSGWSAWMKTDIGKADKSSLRKRFSFCNDDDIIDVDCREVNTKKPSSEFKYISCTAKNGFECLMEDQEKCPEFEVRFNCHCEKTECDARLGMEDGTIKDDQITGSSYLHENLDGKGARLNGKMSWSPEIISSHEWIQVELSEELEVTGVVTQGSSTSKEWVTHFEVMYSSDEINWVTIQENNKPKQFVANIDQKSLKVNFFSAPIYAKFVKILPTEWIHRISLRFELLGCNKIVSVVPEISTVTFAPECVKTGWTEWISNDTPNNDNTYEQNQKISGDNELISNLRNSYVFCTTPTAIRCQTVDKKIASHETGQKVTCNLKDGFKCLNSEQSDGKCLNYEISVYCDCRVSTPYVTTPTTLATTTKPFCPPESKGYTEWMSVGNPVTDSKGDIETIDELRSKYEFCKDKYIKEIECRTKDSKLYYTLSGQKELKCDLKNGFECLHDKQTDHLCVNYEIRFYCQCLEDVITTTEEAPKTESVLAETGSTKLVTQTAGTLCSEWTGWISLSPPNAVVEEELLAEMYGFYETCPLPIDIQCRQVHSHKDYKEFPYLKLDPSCTLEGIRCDNSINDGNCPDFEINVLCECPPPETTTPIPSALKIPPKCAPGWTAWFNTDSPDTAGGDFERIEDLRTHYEFCSDEEISDIKCEPVDLEDLETGAGNLDFRGLNLPDVEVKCTKEFGLECYNTLQPAGKCLDYRITFHCACKQETPPIITTTPYLVVPTITPICNNFTNWYDNDSPDDDEIEEEFFDSVENFAQLCPIVTNVECVELYSGDSYDKFYSPSRLDVPCTSKGFKCTGPDCLDFKIRAHCKCEGVTEAPKVCVDGWTEWFDIDDPNTDDGDFEDMNTLMLQHQFCEPHQIAEVECQSVDGSLDYRKTGDHAVKCSKIIGAACYNTLQPENTKCHDYKIRIKCVCGATPTPFPPAVTSPCADGYTWYDCAYDCHEVCHSFLAQAHKTGECSAEPKENEPRCIAGCLKDECKSPKVWRDKNTCVMRSECTCLMDDGKLLRPGEVVDINKCERCQCLDNVLNCYSVPGCGITSESQVTAAPPLIPIVQPDCWTSWINDNKADKYGDSELIRDIRMKYEFCKIPIAVECRDAQSLVYVQYEKEAITCNLVKGLQCKNNVGVKDTKPCSDYEIRFYCPCENYTTTTYPTTLPTEVIGPCVQGFTDWFNAHYPDTEGEHEQLSEIRQDGNIFCANEYLTTIQCREARTKTSHYRSYNKDLVCTLQEGFYCKANKQPEGEHCDDFEVRYLCDCPTTQPPIIPPITTEVTETPELLTTTVILPECAYWSRWINEDNPGNGEGDVEKTTAAFLMRQEQFCLEGEITNIECVDAITGISYERTGDKILTCTLEFGLTCINMNQPSKMCKDYKIRYYCNCATTTTTPSSPTTIIVTTIKQVTVAPCTEFNSLLDTIPDSNLKASSVFTPSTGPEKARLDSDSAWSPKLSNKNQYLEIDLGTNQPVYGIITRGHPKQQQWVTVFKMMYSRDGVSYDYYMKPNRKTAYNFSGPRVSNGEEKVVLENPFEARYIRILPQAWRNQISMRLDLLGCGKVSVSTVPSTTVRDCDEPMGLENQLLTDNQIFVTSYRDPSRGPTRIRLNTVEDENGSGGWVAERLDEMQYVLIDFREPRVLTGIETQGRHNTDQYVKSYTVQYSNDGETWYDIVDETGGIKVFDGNYDSDTPYVNYFTNPIRARYIKIRPQTWNNWISMRLEVKGCYEPYPTVAEGIAENTATTPPYTTVYNTLTPEYGIILTEETLMPIRCDVKMGLENGKISDSQITLSSSWHGESSGASRIRLNTPEETTGTGGWLAYPSDLNQYIIIDFLKPISLSAIITQGRPKHNEWVESYTVSYSDDGQTWNSVLQDDKKEFTANTDGDTPVTQYFDDVVTARYLRINPTSWHSWIAMRLEVLGCSTPESFTITPQIETCEKFGKWININNPQYYDGDYETVEEIVKYSDFCTNPIAIECRDAVTKIDFRKTGQTVQCDLTHGLYCKNSDQDGRYCFDYEVRILCYSCPINATQEPPGLLVCPEVPVAVAKNCPAYCEVGELCDGKDCVNPLHCACYMDGKKFKPGDRLQTVDCKECECQPDGYTSCRNKPCPPCAAGLKERRGSDCKCYCEPCPPDEIMCESSKECMPREQWCDGVHDCPNSEDEINCPTTTPVPTCPPLPTCAPGTILTVTNKDQPCPTYECEFIVEATTTPKPRIPLTTTCDVFGNYFKTFDGEEFPYDICDHILMQDKNEQKFSVTVHKECDERTNYCTKYILIKQDQHEIRLDADLTVEYNKQIYTPSQLIRLSQSVTDFSIRVLANSVVFKSKIYEFEVEWNSQQNIKIKVGEQLLYKINGLCGLYSDNPNDDFETSFGVRASGTEDFGNSWAIGPLERCKPEVCVATIKMQAVDICNNLVLPPLDACNKFVDSKFYMSACISSICDCLTHGKKKPKECECNAYLTYVEACKNEAPSVKINEWRTKLGCSPTCPPGLVWKDCGPICERTCDNLKDDISECEDSCVAGCYCPDGMVKKKNNTCVTLDKCQDCVCDGYGDPHYNTFDRHYYPFQGNCTYVLARDKSPTGNHNFEVYITNDECLEEPGTTCTTAIMLIYNDHIAHFRVNHSVMLDGVALYPQDFPMEYEGINVTVTSAPDRTITFRVDAISLEVRYFENNYGFQVKLPSEIYYNRTEGLCGNCNYDKSDDITTKDGVITNNTNDFGLSWLATPPEGMEVVDSNCIVHEEKPCINLLEKERCEAILGPQFKPCHLLVDPDSVLRSCQFDVCYSRNPQDSLCRSLKEYARACASVGVCIQNWRSENLCPTNCSEGMYFDQCGSACMKTCKNIAVHEKVLETCDADPVEGCFCIGNRVLKDGVCVDPIECEKCDDDGHGIGDEWQPNACTKCECTEDLTVECTKTECPSKPVCKNDEISLTYPTKANTCCPKYFCFPKPEVKCPDAEIPTCAPGEVSRAVRNPDSCAEYICECDPTQCPSMKEPILSENGQEVVVDNSSCCPIKKVICNKDKCPLDPKCLPGEQLETYHKNKCCPEKTCVPPKDHCYYSHMYGIVDKNAAIKYNDKEALYKPGTSWNDGLCTKCACDGSPGHYNAHCQKEVCPDLDPAIKKNYVIEETNEPGKCCPQIKQIMCLLDEYKFNIGESLPSPDGDKCKKIECVQGPNGDAMKATITASCTKECPKGFEYEESLNTNEECCGKCKPTSCIELDNLYEVGEKWKSVLNKCAMAHCTNDSKVGIVTQYETNCPMLPDNCPIDKIIRDADDCCDICSEVPPTEDCNVEEVDLNETIGIFQITHLGNECINKKPIVGLKQCAGKCESHTIYSSEKKDFESICLCCKHDHMEGKTVQLDCSDGTYVPFTYMQPVTCTCSQCAEQEFVPPVPPPAV